MRPNYAQDAPPASIEVGGAFYDIDTDYRTWLDVVRLLREIRADARAGTDDAIKRMAENIETVECRVFGGILAQEDTAEVLKAVAEFSNGYPAAPYRGGVGERTYSFEYDLNEIIIAIQNQHGVDCSYRRAEPLHWWEFLLLFHTLSGNHYILNLMEIRGYNGKDREMLRRKQAAALPEEYTAEEKAELDAFNAMFDTSLYTDGSEDNG